MCKQRVVATSEASLDTLGDIVVEWQVGAEGVIRVLPVAVLGFVDRLYMVSYDGLGGALWTTSEIARVSGTTCSLEKLTNHSSTK